jgi:hypothetical protein
MARITEQDRQVMIKHLRDLNKASVKANIKHSQNIQKQIDHTIELTKFIKEDRSKISRLENVIDMKQREIDELNSKQMDLLWDLAKLEKENITMKNEIKEDEIRAAEVQKRLTKHFKEESTDN